MARKKNFTILGTMSAIAIGVAGGVLGAFVSVSSPVAMSSNTSVASQPASLAPGTPILLFNNGEAHASVQVNPNGLIFLNLTTRTGQNQIALGVLGDSKLEIGVFGSSGKAKAGMEVPMTDSGRVHMLMFDGKTEQTGAKIPTQS